MVVAQERGGGAGVDKPKRRGRRKRSSSMGTGSGSARTDGWRSSRIRSCLRRAAWSRAVRCRESLMASSAPAVSSTRTTSSCPRLHASMSAVDPCTVCPSMSAPRALRS